MPIDWSTFLKKNSLLQFLLTSSTVEFDFKPRKLMNWNEDDLGNAISRIEFAAVSFDQCNFFCFRQIDRPQFAREIDWVQRRNPSNLSCGDSTNIHQICLKWIVRVEPTKCVKVRQTERSEGAGAADWNKIEYFRASIDRSARQTPWKTCRVSGSDVVRFA